MTKNAPIAYPLIFSIPNTIIFVVLRSLPQNKMIIEVLLLQELSHFCVFAHGWMLFGLGIFQTQINCKLQQLTTRFLAPFTLYTLLHLADLQSWQRYHEISKQPLMKWIEEASIFRQDGSANFFVAWTWIQRAPKNWREVLSTNTKKIYSTLLHRCYQRLNFNVVRSYWNHTMENTNNPLHIWFDFSSPTLFTWLVKNWRSKR